MEGGVLFRIYKPESPDLGGAHQPLEMEPVDAMAMVEEMVAESKRLAPDISPANVTLVPRRFDTDIKRLMKPRIDALMSDTMSALKSIQQDCKA